MNLDLILIPRPCVFSFSPRSGPDEKQDDKDEDDDDAGDESGGIYSGWRIRDVSDVCTLTERLTWADHACTQSRSLSVNLLFYPPPPLQ